MWPFDVHLIPEFLQFPLDRVDGSELRTLVDGLYVLHVFLSLNLDHRGFSENHNSKSLINFPSKELQSKVDSSQ